MPWDSSRPVPWRKLLRSWVLYAVILFAVFAVIYRERGGIVTAVIGVLLSLPLFLGFNWVLYKFGYQRKTWSDLRAERTAAPAATGGSTTGGDAAGVKARPAATRRTSTGHNNPRAKKQRR